ncbi:hypothetical protein EC957_003316 [Mortierella hygrophila]|uniref:Cas12f1-like TNB domain-containing protein n=1 Tax=Mortierella hygrophila TaxID=979708 RepID=A0A9P6K0K4_9FUNG|nr:hypothetical protein EC957_003316 [Mortierella hygrophila]
MTLTLDGGQVRVIGAIADLAEDVLSQAKGKENANESSMEDVTTTTTTDNQTTFLNLAVKQKAVYQSTFRFRRWLEDAKQEQVSVDGQQARSLGYIIVGLNEYYTSKKCPHCGQFVAQVTLRRFYYPECHVYHHRDAMSAENMRTLCEDIWKTRAA